ncbi:hypothetical protein COY27_04380 [Candidatus Woesearchaeota archaeon CG_4_10_14_0_2_um_filter_33_13]|nr:MAG: hypothetical protein COY27_04380 [Candidatus Woesearchaeota archaeon CG_4_10_14_0_2_um_filter_33_13]
MRILNTIIHKIKLVLMEPLLFFDKLRSEQGIKSSFLYFLILSLFGVVMGLIINAIWPTMATSLLQKFMGITLPTETSQSTIIFTTLSFWLLSLLLSFIWAGLLHAWILVFSGKENYEKTYQLYVYSKTPSFVFGWIPFFSLFAWVYSLILLVVGTEKIHSISRKKAILMYLIPVGIFLLLAIGFIFLTAVMIKNNPEFLANLPES